MKRSLAPKILRVFSIAFVMVLLTAFGVGNYFYNIIFDRETHHGQSQYEKYLELQSFDQHWFKRQVSQRVKVNSDYGYELDGLLVYHPDTVQHTMVIAHGLGSDKWGMMKYAQIYQNAGFNLFFYDHSKHGVSGGDKISYGYHEKYDMQKAIDKVKEVFPSGIIGVHGESYGAATAGLHAGNLNESKQDVAFYILDCAYADIYELFAYHLQKDYGLPNLFIVDMANIVTYLRKGFSFKDMSPVNAMAKANTPMLFIHGANDTFTPPEMSEQLYRHKKREKKPYSYSKRPNMPNQWT